MGFREIHSLILRSGAGTKDDGIGAPLWTVTRHSSFVGLRSARSIYTYFVGRSTQPTLASLNLPKKIPGRSDVSCFVGLR